MQVLGFIVLFVAAASAFPTDKFFYRCIPHLSDHSIIFQEETFLCDALDGQRYLVDKDTFIRSFVDRKALVRLVRSPQVLGGLGGSAAGAASQATSGTVSGGIGGGILPFHLGGSVSGAQSSAGSAAGGGGLLGVLG